LSNKSKFQKRARMSVRMKKNQTEKPHNYSAFHLVFVQHSGQISNEVLAEDIELCIQLEELMELKNQE